MHINSNKSIIYSQKGICIAEVIWTCILIKHLQHDWIAFPCQSVVFHLSALPMPMPMLMILLVVVFLLFCIHKRQWTEILHRLLLLIFPTYFASNINQLNIWIHYGVNSHGFFVVHWTNFISWFRLVCVYVDLCVRIKDKTDKVDWPFLFIVLVFLLLMLQTTMQNIKKIKYVEKHVPGDLCVLNIICSKNARGNCDTVVQSVVSGMFEK